MTDSLDVGRAESSNDDKDKPQARYEHSRHFEPGGFGTKALVRSEAPVSSIHTSLYVNDYE